MGYINDNDTNSADNSKPPMDVAKKEIRTILENIQELKLSERVWQLHRIRLQLVKRKTKIRRLQELFEGPLTSLEKIFLFAICTIPLIYMVVVKWNTNDKVIIYNLKLSLQCNMFSDAKIEIDLFDT